MRRLRLLLRASPSARSYSVISSSEIDDSNGEGRIAWSYFISASAPQDASAILAVCKSDAAWDFVFVGRFHGTAGGCSSRRCSAVCETCAGAGGSGNTTRSRTPGRSAEENPGGTGPGSEKYRRLQPAGHCLQR